MKDSAIWVSLSASILIWYVPDADCSDSVILMNIEKRKCSTVTDYLQEVTEIPLIIKPYRSPGR
jgi:hypothetical protein